MTLYYAPKNKKSSIKQEGIKSTLKLEFSSFRRGVTTNVQIVDKVKPMDPL